MNDNQQAERIYQLQQENIRLRGQITYLQEQLSSLEDEKDKVVERLEDRLGELEQSLSDALDRDY